MPFVESAESLRSKLHLTDAKTSAIVGACLAAAVAVGLVIYGAIELTAGNAVEVVRAEDRIDDELSETRGDAAAVEEEPRIYVHVAGAVAKPGMYDLPQGARVQDAIDAAGGYGDDAADSILNLARIVSDGEQILVPTVGELEAEDPTTSNSALSKGDAGGASSSKKPLSADGSVIGGKVNINVADASQLDALPGIGAATAEKIIADREANGPFSSKEDLQRVSGIGAKKYAQLEELICVG